HFKNATVVRTPMQWSAEKHGGFTESDTPILPVITGEPYGYEHINVAQQRRDPNSFLNWTERIIRMRKELPEIGWGKFYCIDCGDSAVLAMHYEWRGRSAVFIHNFIGRERHATFKLNMGAKRILNQYSFRRSQSQRRFRYTPRTA